MAYANGIALLENYKAIKYVLCDTCNVNFETLMEVKERISAGY